MPRRKGVYREEWDVCDRCGFEHPIGMLQMQLGRKLCTCHGCVDDLSIMFRPKVIAEVLADNTENKSDKGEQFKDSGEVRF